MNHRTNDKPADRDSDKKAPVEAGANAIQPCALITWRKQHRDRSGQAFGCPQQSWIARTSGRDKSRSWIVPLSQPRSPFHGLDRTAPRRKKVNVVVAIATPMFYRLGISLCRSWRYRRQKLVKFARHAALHDFHQRSSKQGHTLQIPSQGYW